MKLRIVFAVLFVLLLTGTLFSQEIVRINRPYALVNLNENSGVKVGDEMLVSRNLPDGTVIKVARVQVLLFRDNNCAVKIISENTNYPLEEGDTLTLPSSASLRRQPAQQQGSNQSRNIQMGPMRDQWLSYVSVSAGLVLGGLSYYFFDQAEQTEDTMPTSQEHYNELVDKVEKYDTRSNICMGVGAGLIVYGVVRYFVVRHDLRLADQGTFRITPIRKSNVAGIGIEFALDRR